MVDLWKCFECISFSHLVCQAQKFGLDASCLRVVIAIYMAPRRLVCCEAASPSPLCARRGAMAGSKWAMALLRLALLQALDAHAAAFPGGFKAVFVDDVSAVHVGPRRLVVKLAATATTDLISRLRDSAGFTAAPNKLKAVATRRDLADAFASEMARRGVHGFLAEDATRALGVDFGGGAQRQKSTVRAA